ncbi:hypothetical protein GCM10027396_24870 [Insolitispirillum peregrinum]
MGFLRVLRIITLLGWLTGEAAKDRGRTLALDALSVREETGL